MEDKFLKVVVVEDDKNISNMEDIIDDKNVFNILIRDIEYFTANKERIYNFIEGTGRTPEEVHQGLLLIFKGESCQNDAAAFAVMFN